MWWDWLENGNKKINADGIYIELEAIYGMDVRFRNFDTFNYAYGTTLPSPGRWRVDGHQGRVAQLIDVNQEDTFLGIGYSAGCGEGTSGGLPATGCTGLNAQNGVIKRMYFDGENCGAAMCGYFVAFGKEIIGGSYNSYQLQRNIVDGSPLYRAYGDGVQFAKAYGGNYLNEISVLTERDYGISAAADGSLNMAAAFRQLRWHRYGSASTNPPGLTNYSPPPTGALSGINFTESGTCYARITRPAVDNGSFGGRC